MDGKTDHCKGKLCAKCMEIKPYLQFKLCKNECLACNECGYFWGPANEKLSGKPAKFGNALRYTGTLVRTFLEPRYKRFFEKLSMGQAPNWKCDQRTSDIFCLSQWLMEELIRIKCPDEDRVDVQNFFNRKARAEEDVFELAAKAVNDYLDGKIERYRRVLRGK